MRLVAKNASTLAELEEVRLAALGKKGRVSELLKSLGGMTAEERQVQGPVGRMQRKR